MAKPSDPNNPDQVSYDDPTAKVQAGGDIYDPNSIAAVQGYYTKYTGRAANPNDPQTWLSGGYGYGTDLPTIENAIRNSPEAQAHAHTQGGGGTSGVTNPGTSGNLNDPNYVNQLLSYYATQPGVNPSVINDPNYWRSAVPRFNGDVNYFIQRLMTPEGAPEGSPAGGWQTAAPPVGSVNNGMVMGSADNGMGSQIASLLQQQLQQQQQQQQADQAMRDQFRQSILGQLNTLQHDTTATDPNGPMLSPILNAYHLQSQRGLQDTRNALAEQAYASGTANTGGYQTRQQQALENAGANEAMFTGQQVSSAVQQRQQMLQHLLDVGAGFLSQGEQQGIQTELAALNAQLAREQMAQQQGQFGDTLGFNYSQLEAMLNRDALLNAFGGY